MVLWRLYYHIVWATKERQPLLTPALEPQLHGYIVGKATALGCLVHAIGGMPDHPHLVVSVPPGLAIADCVQRLKGSSAHFANSLPASESAPFAWQRGYGVFSLGSRQLDAAVDYVRQQKPHHDRGGTNAALERDSHEDEPPATWRGGEGLAGVTPISDEAAGRDPGQPPPAAKPAG